MNNGKTNALKLAGFRFKSYFVLSIFQLDIDFI